MREFEIKISTGLCGYDFDYIIEAETRDVAELKAMEVFESDIELMHNRAHISKIIDNGLID